MQPRAGDKDTDGARPQLSAFQSQPGSGVRQACRHIISAQCRERSDGVDTYHVCVMLKI